MSQQTNCSAVPASHHPVPAFQALLAVGAMLATLAVVTYACLLSNDSATRVHVILQGGEVILLTWAAGMVASALHLIGVAGEAITRKAAALAVRAAVGA
jgi:hypothetical protein